LFSSNFLLLLSGSPAILYQLGPVGFVTPLLNGFTFFGGMVWGYTFIIYNQQHSPMHNFFFITSFLFGSTRFVLQAVICK
jgi:hypothetical protein